jgi:hypothetical protein
MGNDSHLDLSVTSKNTHLKSYENDLRMEVNWGLALPVSYYKEGGSEKTAKKIATIRSKTSEGLKITTVATQSDLGPLGSYEIDVLLALLTMTYEQDLQGEEYGLLERGEKQVVFTVPEICKRLGLVYKNSAYRIMQALKIIKSQTIFNHSFNVLENGGLMDIEDEDGAKLFSTEVIKAGARGLQFKDFRKVYRGTWPKNVYKNLINEYVSVLNSNHYISLKRGPQRRVFIFLHSKKKKLASNEITFSLNELSHVLGLEESSKRRRQIVKYMDAIMEVTDDFQYRVSTKKNDDWVIWVKFDSEKKELTADNKFISALSEYYGPGIFEDFDFSDRMISLWEREYLSKYEKITGKKTYSLHKGQEINAVELAVDLALYQQKYCSYNITSLKGLVGTIVLKNLSSDINTFPDGYEDFIFNRIKKKEEQAINVNIENGRKRIEDQKLKDDLIIEEAASMAWEINKKDKSFMSDLLLRSIEDGRVTTVSKDEAASLEGFQWAILEASLKNIFFEDFLKGEALRSSSIVGKSHEIDFKGDKRLQ